MTHPIFLVYMSMVLWRSFCPQSCVSMPTAHAGAYWGQHPNSPPGWGVKRVKNANGSGAAFHVLWTMSHTLSTHKAMEALLWVMDHTHSNASSITCAFQRHLHLLTSATLARWKNNGRTLAQQRVLILQFCHLNVWRIDSFVFSVVWALTASKDTWMPHIHTVALYSASTDTAHTPAGSSKVCMHF